MLAMFIYVPQISTDHFLYLFAAPIRTKISKSIKQIQTVVSALVHLFVLPVCSEDSEAMPEAQPSHQ